VRVWRKIASEGTRCQSNRPIFCGKIAAAVPDEIKAASEIHAVNDDSDAVAILNFSNGSSCQSFGAYVPDAGASGNARKTRVREQGHMFSKG
jgi:hypothetical protein